MKILRCGRLSSTNRKILFSTLVLIQLSIVCDSIEHATPWYRVLTTKAIELARSRLGQDCTPLTPTRWFQLQCIDQNTRKRVDQDAHILMLNVQQNLRRVATVSSFRYGGQLGLLEKSATLKVPDAPTHIGVFDKFTVPFAFIAAAHQLAAPESYLTIKPKLRSRLFPQKTPASNYLLPTTSFGTLTDVTVIFHDWLSTPDETIYVQLYDALNSWNPTTHLAIMVDWRVGAQARDDIMDVVRSNNHKWYNQAALNAAVVGRELGFMLAVRSELVTVNLIGVGLGAHAAYFAADWFHQTTTRRCRVNRLTAIDPSMYGFLAGYHREKNPILRYRTLFREVAEGVDVIHSSQFGRGLNGYGANENLGTVDIFINPFVTRNTQGDVTGYRFTEALCREFEVVLGEPKTHCATDGALQAYIVSIMTSTTPGVQARRCDHIERDVPGTDCATSHQSYQALQQFHDCQAQFGFGLDHTTVKRGKYVIDTPPLTVGAGGATGPTGRRRRSLVNESFVEMWSNDFESSTFWDEEFDGDQSDNNATLSRPERQLTTLTPPTRIMKYPLSKKDIISNIPFKAGTRFDRPNCGLFRAYPGSGTSRSTDFRVYQGFQSYKGQFPWNVCIQFHDTRQVVQHPTSKVVYIKSVATTYGNALYQVASTLGNDQYNEGLSSDCVGSLIDNQWVVTAAHCFSRPYNGLKMRLIFGAITCEKAKAKGSLTMELSIQKTPSTVVAQNVFVHPTYMDRVNQESDDEDLDAGLACESVGGAKINDDNKDIALIRLPRHLTDTDLAFEVSNINTICLENSTKIPFNTHSSLTAYAAGFGYKDTFSPATFNNAVQPYLSFLRYSVFQNGVHTIMRPSSGVVSSGRGMKAYLVYDADVDTELQFCVELDDNLQRDTAGGDSGGPLMVLTNNLAAERARAVLIGTLVRGPDCCKKVFVDGVNFDHQVVSPAVYTRVDKQLDWIKLTIEEAEKI